tara:strand:- start:445 stop:777 length:333 start_codon:yes stop_codon:yes gene_type:complete
MSATQGSEELLIDIGSNSRIRIFSIFSIDNFVYNASPRSFGFVLKDGSGGSVIYSAGISDNSGSFNLRPGYSPNSSNALPEHGIECLSDLYVEGIGTSGTKALTICYQVG